MQITHAFFHFLPNWATMTYYSATMAEKNIAWQLWPIIFDNNCQNNMNGYYEVILTKCYEWQLWPEKIL